VVRIRGRRGASRVLTGKSQGKTHLEESGRDGRIILKWVLKKQDGGVGRIDLDQNSDRWRAVQGC
jgi:hypothetical protein